MSDGVTKMIRYARDYVVNAETYGSEKPVYLLCQTLISCAAIVATAVEEAEYGRQ